MIALSEEVRDNPSLSCNPNDNRNEECSEDSKEIFISSRECNKKKVNSLPAGIVPPLFGSEERFSEEDINLRLVRKHDSSFKMTPSATSPSLTSSSKNDSNWDKLQRLKNRSVSRGHFNASTSSEESDSEKKDKTKESVEKHGLNMESHCDYGRSCVQGTALSIEKDKKYESGFHNNSKKYVDEQEFEKEKLLRQTAEERLKEVTLEKNSFKEQIACLKEEIRKKDYELLSTMRAQKDIGSRSHLDNKYEQKLQNCQINVARLGKVNSLLVKEIRNLEGVMSSLDQPESVNVENKANKVLLERIKYLEAENASLVMESEQQRILYERCLDDVANQVVQALLVQKSLQETCSKLKKRVDDLEEQNRTLHILFRQQMSWDPTNLSSNVVSTEVSPIRPTSPEISAIGKKIIRSFSSSTSCSHSSSSSSRSPCGQSDSSNSSTGSDYSPQSPYKGERLSEYHSGNMSYPVYLQDKMHASFYAPSRYSNENSRSFAESNRTCWKDSCNMCKEEHIRGECYSACSCNSPPVNTISHRDQAHVGSPYNKEKRALPHGPVMGMTDLLRLNRKSTDPSASGSFDNHQWLGNRSSNYNSKQVDGDVDMKLDSMKTPSEEDQQCLYKNLENPISDQKAIFSLNATTAANLKPNMKYKLYEESSKGIVATSWRGSYNPNCYTAALNTASPKIPFCQRPHHLKLCNHYTLPPNLIENKAVNRNCNFNFDKDHQMKVSDVSTIKLSKDESNSKLSDIVENSNHKLINVISSSLSETSGLESVETSPKDSILCSSASEDVSQDDSTAKKLGSKDEGYSTMSSDIQCEGEADDQSRRASINISPDFLSYDSLELKQVNKDTKATVDHNIVITDSNQNEQHNLVQISSQAETAANVTELNKSSSINNKVNLSYSFRDNEPSVHYNCGKKVELFQSLKNEVGQESTFGSLSLLSLKTGHVEAIKEKFESKKGAASVFLELKNDEHFPKSQLSKCNIEKLTPKTSSENLLPKSHIIDGDDADVFYLPIYCPLTSDNSTIKETDKDYFDTTLKRSQSDSCLFSGHHSRKSFSNNSFDSWQENLSPVNCLGYHRSAWELTNNHSQTNDDLMALYRSKACLSLIESSPADYLSISPYDTTLSGWHSSFSPTSLHSINSQCSGSGEARVLHEALASGSRVSIESACLFSSNDEIDVIGEEWFLNDLIISEKEYTNHLEEDVVNYNDEEVCNWSLNYSSEEICSQQSANNDGWSQVNEDRKFLANTFPHGGSYCRPTESLPSIQEVDDDDGESFISLPSKCNMIEKETKCSEKSGRAELRNRIRRKEGTCNSWPNTANRSCKMWCKAKMFMNKLNGLHPSLPTDSINSVKSWDSSMRCVSEDLSDDHLKDLSVSSFGIDSEFASTPDSKSSVGPSVANLEYGDLAPFDTHFTRDFYRLCKVESCKSLDVSCKSLVAANSNPREVQQDAATTSNVLLDNSSQTESPELKIRKNEIAGTCNKSDENNPSSLSFAQSCGAKEAEDVSKGEKWEKNAELSRCENLFDNEEMETDMNEGVDEFSMKKEGCTTSWVHFETDVDLSDPKARANLLDSMVASSTSSSDTEADSDIAEDENQYQHLHDIHRVRRFRRAYDREQCVVRYVPPARPSILDRKDFYYRFGEQEKEAVASFDFLESMSTSISDVGSLEALDSNSSNKDRDDIKSHRKRSNVLKKDASCRSYSGFSDRLYKNRVDKLSLLESDHQKFSSLDLSRDVDVSDRLSFSDSCAESFSCSYTSLNMEL